MTSTHTVPTRIVGIVALSGVDVSRDLEKSLQLCVFFLWVEIVFGPKHWFDPRCAHFSWWNLVDHAVAYGVGVRTSTRSESGAKSVAFHVRRGT